MKFLPTCWLRQSWGYVWGPAPPVSDGFAGVAVSSRCSPPAKVTSPGLRIFPARELR